MFNYLEDTCMVKQNSLQSTLKIALKLLKFPKLLDSFEIPNFTNFHKNFRQLSTAVTLSPPWSTKEAPMKNNDRLLMIMDVHRTGGPLPMPPSTNLQTKKDLNRWLSVAIQAIDINGFFDGENAIQIWDING